MACIVGIRTLCRVLSLAEEHYPQNLRKAIIVNVPNVFYSAIWPLVQRALDDETRANVLICNDHGCATIAEHIGVDVKDVRDVRELLSIAVW